MVSTFRLSYGVANQAAQLIEETPTAYLLHGTETVYSIERGSGSDLEDGFITIIDTTTGFKVIDTASVAVRTSAAAEEAIGNAVSASFVLSNDRLTLTATYEDLISATTRTRQHVFTVEGNAVRVLIEATGVDQTDLLSNYAGVFGGYFDRLAGFTTLEMPGVLATPIVGLKYQGQMRYFAHILDITQSHASDFTVTDSKVEDVADWYYTTAWDYAENTAGEIQKGLREVLMASVSYTLRDCFIHPSDGSTQIQRLALNPWTLLTSSDGDSGSWTTFGAYLEQRSEWGMTRGTIYPQFWWQEINYPTSVGQANGQHWYPSGESAEFATYGELARALGFDIGGYTLWGIQKEVVPNYDANKRVLDTDGSPRPSVWGGDVWLSTEESIEFYMDLYLPTIKEEYKWNMIMYDVETYASPTKGSGNHVDNAAGSPSGTLRDVIEIRRAWMKYGRSSIADDAFTYGEGSHENHTSEMEYLWAGAIDGVHRWVNTNGNQPVDEETDPLRMLGGWYVSPEYEWAVTNQYFCNTGDLPERFFSQAEILELQDPGVTTLYPFSRAMNDRLRAFTILLGKPGVIHVPGANLEHFMSYREQIKEYYMMNTLTAPMRDGTVPDIFYHSADVRGYETFSERLQRVGMDGFRNTRVNIRFESGYQAYVNQSDTDWVITSILGTQVTLPPDGFFCCGVSGGVLTVGGSCSTTATRGLRVDFAIVTGSMYIADGRGRLTGFQGVPLPGGRMVFKDFENQFQLKEILGHGGQTSIEKIIGA